MIEAKIIADSVAQNGARITTLELQYPRFIHGEVMTHRVFSRNAMSSRAIPVAKMLEQVRNNPAMPVYWGANQPGMQAAAELDGQALSDAKAAWMSAAEAAADVASAMEKIGLHKQIANRVLEPFQWMRTIVTATQWDNFFSLRCHPDAQPEFQALAVLIRDAMAAGLAQPRNYLWEGDRAWHLPYVSVEERDLYRLDVLLKLSTARCARVSYLTHDGATPDVQKDVGLYERLVGSEPRHSSPAEHQARAGFNESMSNNFRGWVQHRAYLDQGDTPC